LLLVANEMKSIMQEKACFFRPKKATEEALFWVLKNMLLQIILQWNAGNNFIKKNSHRVTAVFVLIYATLSISNAIFIIDSLEGSPFTYSI
jgi:hypothetical protein